MAGTSLIAQPLLRDTFDDATVDGARWTVFQPISIAPPSAVTETNGTLLLFRRGIVEATGTFPPGIDIEGKTLTLGEPLEMDVNTERFTNSDRANALLTRNYRAPYIVPDFSNGKA